MPLPLYKVRAGRVLQLDFLQLARPLPHPPPPEQPKRPPLRRIKKVLTLPAPLPLPMLLRQSRKRKRVASVPAVVKQPESVLPSPALKPEQDVHVSPDLSYNSRIKPRYPLEARRRQHEGTVVLLVWVGTDGLVKGIKVEQSSRYHELDRAAVEAVRRWHFNPAIGHGKKLESHVRVPISFALE